MATTLQQSVGKQEFGKLVAQLEARTGYKRPAASGIGLARLAPNGLMLDVRFLALNRGEHFGSAAVLANWLGHSGRTMIYSTVGSELNQLLSRRFSCFYEDPPGSHPNYDALQAVRQAMYCPQLPHGRRLCPVFAFIGDLSDPPISTADVYFRLHLISSRKVQPREINLAGIDSLLNTVAWTSQGPMLPEDVPAAQAQLLREGGHLEVRSVDKFPRMTDYVVPSDVRIVNADTVPLGEYLPKGAYVNRERRQGLRW